MLRWHSRVRNADENPFYVPWTYNNPLKSFTPFGYNETGPYDIFAQYLPAGSNICSITIPNQDPPPPFNSGRAVSYAVALLVGAALGLFAGIAYERYEKRQHRYEPIAGGETTM